MKPVNLSKLVQAFEDKWILKAMRKARNNRAHASELLGLNRTTLIEKLRIRGWLSKLKPGGHRGWKWRTERPICLWCGVITKSTFCDNVCKQKWLGSEIDKDKV